MLIRATETATSIAGIAYCGRIPYCTLVEPFSGAKSPATVAGNIEHEYIEHYLKLADLESSTITKLNSRKLHDERKNKLYDYIEKLVIPSSPEYGDLCRDTLDSLSYRMDIFFHDLIRDSTSLLAEYDYDTVKKLIFPWKIEEKLYDHQHGIRSKADLIYRNIDSSLRVVDIKSHSSRVDALMYRDSHFMQLVTYAIAVAQKFRLACNDVSILYSQDMYYWKKTVTDPDRAHVIELRDQLRFRLLNPMPPLLTGTDKQKCKYCYHQKTCAKLSDYLDVPATTFPVLDLEAKQ